jgi:hypothetical protein
MLALSALKHRLLGFSTSNRSQATREIANCFVRRDKFDLQPSLALGFALQRCYEEHLAAHNPTTSQGIEAETNMYRLWFGSAFPPDPTSQAERRRSREGIRLGEPLRELHQLRHSEPSRTAAGEGGRRNLHGELSAPIVVDAETSTDSPHLRANVEMTGGQ